MNTVSSWTPHNAAERRKKQMNTSRMDKVKNNIPPTARVDRTRRPVDGADNPSNQNKRRTTNTIDYEKLSSHRLLQILQYGHDYAMDTTTFTNLDCANTEIRKLRKEIDKREERNIETLKENGRLYAEEVRENGRLTKLLTERDAEVTNLKSAVSKIIADMQSRLGETDEAKNITISPQ